MFRGVVTGIVAIAVAIGVVGTSTGASEATPRLRVIDASPLTLAGSSFRSRESVRLTVRQDDVRATRLLRATLAGRFTARFLAESLGDRCGGVLWATAVGSRGSRATLKLPQPLCPPALSPP